MPGVYRHVPFEDRWMDNAENEALYNELNTEYERNAVELRLLAQAADATVRGIGEELYIRENLGDDFFAYHSSVEPNPPSLQRLSDPLLTSEEADRLMRGYHFRARGDGPDVGDILLRARDTIDSVGPYSRLDNEAREKFLEEVTGFGKAQLLEVGWYGSTLVVVVNEADWQRDVDAQAGTVIAGKYRHTAKGPIILVNGKYHGDPETFRSIVEHEYGHAIDAALPRDARTTKADQTFWELKSELVATSSETAYAAVDWKSFTKAVHDGLGKTGYGHLTDTLRRSEQFERLFSALPQLDPFVVGLMQEMGIDPADHVLRRTVTRTFLLAMPSRSAGIKMLESIPDTETYRVGADWLKEHDGMTSETP